VRHYRKSPRSFDGADEQGPMHRNEHDGSGGHHPQSCTSFSRIDPFLCAAFSAHKRVTGDVASFPVRGRRRKCADARRSNADTAVNITGCGGSACIGVLCDMPRDYMARASHSGSCEHGRGDQCSRQKFKLSHLISPLHMKSQRRVAPPFGFTTIKGDRV
jgi:hypothetical protein